MIKYGQATTALLLFAIGLEAQAGSSSVKGLYRYSDPRWFRSDGYDSTYGIPVNDGRVFLSDFGVSLNIVITAATNGDQWTWELTGPQGESHGGLRLTYWDSFTDLNGEPHEKCFVFTQPSDGSQVGGRCGIDLSQQAFEAATGYGTYCTALGAFNVSVNGASTPFEFVSAGPTARVLLNQDLLQAGSGL